MKKKCENSDCGMEYEVTNENDDIGVCSFECWEKRNCHEPERVSFELLEVE